MGSKYTIYDGVASLVCMDGWRIVVRKEGSKHVMHPEVGEEGSNVLMSEILIEITHNNYLFVIELTFRDKGMKVEKNLFALGR